MKTTTEIQIRLDPDEYNLLYRTIKFIEIIRDIAAKANDPITLMCWDEEHDYVEYDFIKLHDAYSLLAHIYKAAEIGFISREGEGEEHD